MDEHKEIEALELELINPVIRKKAERLNLLISDDFEEVSSSGMVYRKTDILQILAREEPVAYELSGFVFTKLAKDCILVKYGARSPEKNTLRASIWVKSNGNWQIIHHQATVIPDTV